MKLLRSVASAESMWVISIPIFASRFPFAFCVCSVCSPQRFLKITNHHTAMAFRQQQIGFVTHDFIATHKLGSRIRVEAGSWKRINSRTRRVRLHSAADKH